MFFSFDGVDGVGKSTQIQLLTEWLRGRDRQVTVCRDPGSTAIGEAVRKILLDRDGASFGLRSEMLLYMAARAQLVEEVIGPALSRGEIVLSDRYLLANVAYQGYAGGLSVEDIWLVGHVATRHVLPTTTFLLDMPVEEALPRLGGEHDRLESRGVEYMEQVRQGFLEESRRRPGEVIVIDANRQPQQVHGEIRDYVASLLGEAE